MITLALAQMFYFFCLQAPFTDGEDGIQGVPRGTLFGLIDLEQLDAMYYVVAGGLRHRRFRDLAHRQLALRHDPEIDPRERAARHLARLFGRALQARRLRACRRRSPGSRAASRRIVFQFATLTDVAWQMSGEVILMTLLGGIGTLVGPLIGAGFVVGARKLLSRRPTFR